MHFYSPSIHQAIFSHSLGVIKVHLVFLQQLPVASSIALKDEDQHLNLATCKSSLYRWIFRAMFFYRCHGGSHSSSTCMDTLDVLLASQYSRVCYFVKTGFICCGA
ncbi:hypothetical protein O0I10_007153 [Lichtheimia ornata]|uniref:Uncharacterized protein n=1 Tax=Lichtheimia ornata TaxID=688661 RepID=A0AAD7V1T0_9FUNG|nr:uncharacterized protein O0I10_007153 [Lichtheimia ornata]KAJ8657073.1 hypothetical protein O0I10_007153 [Lichtheimia ornata]